MLGTLALTGCSEKQQANETLPSASATPSTEELPPLGPPDFPVPDEARTKDAAGAEAFVRYYIDLLNRLQAIPAGGPLRELSPECATCLRIARAFDDAAAAGHTYFGGQLTVNDIAEPQVEGDIASLGFTTRVEAVSVRDKSGVPVPNGQADLMPNAGSGMTLKWSEHDRAWFAAGLTVG